MDDEEKSTEPGIKRKASLESTCLADLATAFNAIAVHCSESSRRFDQLSADERRVLLRKLASEFGSLGDLCHEANKACDDLADQGSPPRS